VYCIDMCDVSLVTENKLVVSSCSKGCYPSVHHTHTHTRIWRAVNGTTSLNGFCLELKAPTFVADKPI
jgi:hypothetical protein